MVSLLILVNTLIQLYMIVIIAQVVMSWLLVFNVVNIRNQFVYAVTQTLYQLTEPVYRPIRRILPNLGAIDLSPLVVILVLAFVQNLLWEYWPR